MSWVRWLLTRSATGVGLDELADNAIASRLAEADDETARALAADTGVGDGVARRGLDRGSPRLGRRHRRHRAGRVAAAVRAARDRLDAEAP